MNDRDSSPRRRLPQPAMLVALLALAIALGGTAYAAMEVTGKDVVDGSLTGADFKPDSVRAREVRERSLKRVPSARHAQTLGGLQPQAFVGSSKYREVIVVEEVGPDNPDGIIQATAPCKTNEIVTGGSYFADGELTGTGVEVLQDGPSDAAGNLPDPGEVPGGWTVTGRILDGTGVLRAYAVCATRAEPRRRAG